MLRNYTFTHLTMNLMTVISFTAIITFIQGCNLKDSPPPREPRTIRDDQPPAVDAGVTTPPREPRTISVTQPPAVDGTIYISVSDSTTDDRDNWRGELYSISLNETSALTWVVQTEWRSEVGVSPTGDNYLVTSPNGIVEFRSPDHRITATATASSPRYGDRYSWTDDGQVACWGSYIFGIYCYNLLSNSLSQNTEGGSYDHAVALAPDGSYFVHAHHEQGNQVTLYSQPFSKNLLFSSNPNLFWSGESGEHDEELATAFISPEDFVFKITWPSNNSAIYLGSARTNDVSQVIEDFNIKDMVVSPDRGWIAYSVHNSSADLVGRIIKIADTSTWQSRFVDSLDFYPETRLAWSPDGRFIALATCCRGAGTEIWLYDVDGVNKWKLGQLEDRRGVSIVWGKK
jgi:Tol biopolymer transport system component